MSFLFEPSGLAIDLQTQSVEQTEQAGFALAQLLRNSKLPKYVALRGDLGVGKTAFVRGFVRELCPGALVRSPTFSLVNEYRTDAVSPRVYHFDMYRITSEDDLYSIGYDDYLDAGYCLVEWSENIPYALPDRYLRVTIEKISVDTPDSRRILIEAVGL